MGWWCEGVDGRKVECLVGFLSMRSCKQPNSRTGRAAVKDSIALYCRCCQCCAWCPHTDHAMHSQLTWSCAGWGGDLMGHPHFLTDDSRVIVLVPHCAGT